MFEAKNLENIGNFECGGLIVVAYKKISVSQIIKRAFLLTKIMSNVGR